MNTTLAQKRRILVIDDNPAIHEDFRKILCPAEQLSDELRDAAAAVFGMPPKPARAVEYEVDAASSGQDGLDRIRRKILDERCYSLAFVDMRMPNGWNGIETVRRIWELSPGLQVVLCTAYSDFSWDQIRTELPHSDRFLILKKPFDNIEVQQIAEALSERYATELELLEKDRVLKEAQNIAKIGHFISDARTGRLARSESLTEIFGIDAEIISSVDDWVGLVEEPYNAPLQQAIIDTAHSFAEFEQMCRVTHRVDGSSRWVLARGRWEADPEGLPARLIGTFQDITEMYESQERLRLLEQSVSQINDAIIITDVAWQGDDGPRIVYVNEAFVRQTGYAAEEAIGRTPFFLQSPNTSRVELDRIAASITKGHPIRLELINQTRDGKEFWVDLDVVPVKRADGICTHWVFIERDISSQKKSTFMVERLAYYDELTGLPNRRLLDDRLRQTLASCGRNPVYCALLFIDLDDFKEVNDTFGHKAGDLLLVEVATRLRACVREEDTVARFGGDEFVILLKALGTEKEQAILNAENVSRKIMTALASSYLLSEPEYPLSASIGITMFDGNSVSTDELLKRADIAMYRAKSSGKNAFAMFESGMQVVVNQRAQLANELRHALSREQLELHYQALVESGRGITGAEALLRWTTPERGRISPSIFVPLAEQTGFIKQMGEWVLNTACAELARWAQLPHMASLTLSINVSPKQFNSDCFVEEVLQALKSAGAPPEKLKLELTETVLIQDISAVASKMEQFKLHGIGIALDDFGTGYSSLSYLKQLPLDQLKIDQSFVRDLLADKNDASIASAIIGLGQSLGLTVIAEGVETIQQQRFLSDIGCNVFQGYLFARPIPVGEFEDLVRGWGLPPGY
ncbi:MAG: EAL domain-containing protein [Methyloversatilis sp.]|nr:EAL domain-containing protein [Methyloversatilis sp.]